MLAFSNPEVRESLETRSPWVTATVYMPGSNNKVPAKEAASIGFSPDGPEVSLYPKKDTKTGTEVTFAVHFDGGVTPCNDRLVRGQDGEWHGQVGSPTDTLQYAVQAPPTLPPRS